MGDVEEVVREIDAGGTAFRAAIEAGDEELERGSGTPPRIAWSAPRPGVARR
jgi:hypothetical protein